MPTLDLNTLNNLKETTGEDFIAELVEAFLEDAQTQMADLRSALASHDTETFRRAAHSLKSNAATFGATDLTNLARELEMMGREKNLAISNQLETLQEAFDLVKEQLLSELR